MRLLSPFFSFLTWTFASVLSRRALCCPHDPSHKRRRAAGGGLPRDTSLHFGGAAAPGGDTRLGWQRQLPRARTRIPFPSALRGKLVTMPCSGKGRAGGLDVDPSAFFFFFAEAMSWIPFLRGSLACPPARGEEDPSQVVAEQAGLAIFIQVFRAPHTPENIPVLVVGIPRLAT